jgi:hypothetical protein
MKMFINITQKFVLYITLLHLLFCAVNILTFLCFPAYTLLQIRKYEEQEYICSILRNEVYWAGNKLYGILVAGTIFNAKLQSMRTFLVACIILIAVFRRKQQNNITMNNNSIAPCTVNFVYMAMKSKKQTKIYWDLPFNVQTFYC